MAPTTLRELQEQLDEAREENSRLRKQVECGQAVQQCGYLYKFRASPHTIFSSSWAQRFVTLTGTRLSFYKNEKDVSFFPRASVDVQGCLVEYEGVKRSRFHVFNVYKAGVSVARLSSPSQPTVSSWVNSLVKCGCTVRYTTKQTLPLDPSTPRNRPAIAVPTLRPHLERYSDSSDAASELSGPIVTTERLRRRSSAWRELKESKRDAGGKSSSRSDPPRSTPVDCLETGESSLTDNSSIKDTTIDELSPINGRPTSTSSGPNSPTLQPAPAPRKHAGMLGSTPVHTAPRFSYLSSERITYQKHSGLVNLGMVIILATNSRLILENVMKYGVRANPLRWIQRGLASSSSSNRPVLVCFAALLLLPLLALGIESVAVLRLRLEERLRLREEKEKDQKGASSQTASVVTELLVWGAHAVVSVILPIAMPIAVLHMTDGDPLPSLVLVMCAITIWMKLMSYAHCNWDLRCARRRGQVRAGERGTVFAPPPDVATGPPASEAYRPTLAYPENITLRNILYFMVVPTLTYQMEYPRTPRIRSRWLLRRIAELLAYGGLLLFIVDQYLEPSIMNSLLPFHESNYFRITERVLKLSLPFMYTWLCIFYLFFHLWLNILAELTRFGDREFYKDWWNATTIGEYWRLWNMPVHKWMLRTVYHPLTRAGCNKVVSGFACFFVSAIMHELAVGLPLRTLRGWAFVGMLFQVPMMHITEALKSNLKNEQVGNIIFWLSFCVVGQPMCALLYYHDWVLAHSPQLLHAQKPEDVATGVAAEALLGMI